MQHPRDLHHSPHLYTGAGLITTAAILTIYRYAGFDHQYFLLPVIILALFHTVLNLIKQRESSSHFYFARHMHWLVLLKRALTRYMVWLCLIYSAKLLFEIVPYYSSNQFQGNSQFFDQLISVYLFLGLPYFILTLLFKASRREDFYDPAIRLIHIFKQIGLNIFVKEGDENPFRVLRNQTNRKVVLNLIMRTYFIPVMVVQVLGNSQASLNLMVSMKADHYYLRLLIFITAFLWLADIINATMAYCLESRWLENRSQSIDQTWIGWLVCLCCYPPLNDATAYIFPFAPFVATDNINDLVQADFNLLVAVKSFEAVFLFIHVYSNLSLGPSIANITLKKLQTRGPYAIIRHPGTTTKLLLWFVASMFYRRFWTLKMLYGYVMWGAIYIARAMTEERHLAKYQHYKAYMRKVKYRFIPRIF